MNRVLGRGIEALIPTKVRTAEPKEAAVMMIEVDKIRPNRYQPRMNIDEGKLSELAESIKQQGIVQPVLVTPQDDHYELIAGERRWSAAKKASLKVIPAIIREVSESDRFKIALIENIQREDLNPVEEAYAYDRIMKEFSMTQEMLSDELGCTRSALANKIRLIRLPEEIKKEIAGGLLSEGHARALVTVSDAKAQKLLADKIIRNRLTVRETEKLVKSLSLRRYSKRKAASREKDADLMEQEEILQRKLGTKVEITPLRKKGKYSAGKLIVYYSSYEDLDRIIECLGVSRSN